MQIFSNNEILWDGGSEYSEQIYLVLGSNSSSFSRKIIVENNFFNTIRMWVIFENQDDDGDRYRFNNIFK